MSDSKPVRVTERTWADVVRAAEQLEKPAIPQNRDPGYEWSNGRSFYTPPNPYA